jgi:hypothetical protein
LVSVVLVTDPFGDYDEHVLRRTFDHVVPYKEHFVADTVRPLEEFVSRSHRENARRALRKVTVEVCRNPSAYLNDWVDLYSVLAQRHGIRGLRAFSREAFAMQLRVPGLVMFRAIHAGETVGLDLWYLNGEVAQGHLAAFSEKGYSASASYATKWTVLNFFADKARWINFGGLAGSAGSSGAGLRHFKAGWSSTTRKTYICGRILNAPAYQELAAAKPDTAYFPAYRSGEY